MGQADLEKRLLAKFHRDSKALMKGVREAGEVFDIPRRSDSLRESKRSRMSLLSF